MSKDFLKMKIKGYLSIEKKCYKIWKKKTISQIKTD